MPAVTGSRPLWIVVYAAAMAFVEAAVVVYLRMLPPSAAGVPQIPGVEVAREAATIVMLLAVARLAGRDRWEQFLYFCIAFGIWDVGYYVWLKLLIGWPPSLLTWDVLFLIPVPWLAPVLAPLIVSAALVSGSACLLTLRRRVAVLRFPLWVWALGAVGGAVVLLSFTLDYRVAARGLDPPGFRWPLFATGVLAGVVGFGVGILRLRRTS
jgi:hypothetical protein